jgi:hypothetical protein
MSRGLGIGDNRVVEDRSNERALTMPRILRVNNPHGEPVGTAESPEGVERRLQDIRPGRYHIDEIRRDPLPSGHTSRRWGVAIRKAH